jgi:hypothetical protein
LIKNEDIQLFFKDLLVSTDIIDSSVNERIDL